MNRGSVGRFRRNELVLAPTIGTRRHEREAALVYRKLALRRKGEERIHGEVVRGLAARGRAPYLLGTAFDAAIG